MTARRPDTAPTVGKHTPGPGTYESKNRQFEPAWTVGTGKRTTAMGKSYQPGPGN